MDSSPSTLVRRSWRSALAQALLLGLLCAVAVSIAGALSQPASTPEGRSPVTRWLAPVPEGWPSEPWSEARHERGWARETWELRGDPPMTASGRASDFAAMWSLRSGWPFPAFVCTRLRLRRLWDQGDTFSAPWDGASASWREGIVIPAARLGASEGQFLLPVEPLWGGLLLNTVAWALPFLVIGFVTEQVMGRRRRAPHSPSTP